MQTRNNKTYQVINDTWYDCRTPADLIKVLERVRQDHTRIHLYYGDTDTGRVWEEGTQKEMGTLGRSMGPIKIPLLIRTSRSMGGEAILDHCILQIRKSPISRSGELLYQHPALTRLQHQQVCDVLDRVHKEGKVCLVRGHVRS